MSCVIDAAESRFIATTDIPDAFLHADMDDFVIMKIEGKLAELMVYVDRNVYSQFITRTSSGKTILMSSLRKRCTDVCEALYCFMRGSRRTQKIMVLKSIHTTHVLLT